MQGRKLRFLIDGLDSRLLLMLRAASADRTGGGRAPARRGARDRAGAAGQARRARRDHRLRAGRRARRDGLSGARVRLAGDRAGAPRRGRRRARAGPRGARGPRRDRRPRPALPRRGPRQHAPAGRDQRDAAHGRGPALDELDLDDAADPLPDRAADRGPQAARRDRRERRALAGGLSTLSVPPSDSTRAPQALQARCRASWQAPPAPSSATLATSARPAPSTATRSSLAPACLIAFESASETRNQTVVSTTRGQAALGQRVDRATGSGDWTASAASAPRRPRSRPTGCRPRASSRSSRPASAACSRAAASRCCAPAGSCSSSRSARSSAWPSTTSRCCAPSCRSRPIRRRSSSAACTARARRDDLVRASAQRALVAAALELGGGPGGEDLQRLQLARRGSSGAERDHADVADRAAVGAAQRDREVAVEAVGAEEAVGADSAGGRRGGTQQQVGARRRARTACRRARTRSPRAAPCPARTR